ncbi:MAG: BlaI/MecI/CopY family transcriptional regulator [Bacteroidota bacterium]
MELTKAEEQVMQILWKIEKGFVKDVLDHYEEPKPAYTTVATIIKILEKKGYLSHETYGNAHQFFPVVSKIEYSIKQVNPIFGKYFSGSIKDVVSFFAANNKIETDDINDAIRLLSELKNKKQ